MDNTKQRCLANPVSLLIIMLALVAAGPVRPQNNKSAVSISGEFGAYGELYDINGRPSRRDDNTWHLYFKPTLTINNIHLPFEFFLSSENTGVRQPVNRFTFRPDWSWGGLQIGDVNARHSEFTLNGVKLRGGALKMNPGVFRLAVAGGRTQWDIDADSLNGKPAVFQRNVYAGTIGIGKEGGSFLDLNVLKAEDDTSSVVNPGAAQPHENLVASLNGQLYLLQSRLRLHGEVSGAAFTRDTRSSRYTTDDIPDIVDDLFSIRLSSRVSGAFLGEAEYNDRSLGLKTIYRRINSGYVSLGLPYLINDQEQWRIIPRLRLLRNRLNLRLLIGQRRDNLADEKRFTTTRNDFRIYSSFRANRSFSISGGFNLFDLGNDAPAVLQLKQTSRQFSLRPNFFLSSGDIRHQIRLGMLLQQIEVLNGPTGRLQDTDVLNLNGAWALQFPSGWGITPGFNYQDNRVPGAESSFITYTLGSQASLLNRKLTPGITLSLNKTRNPDSTDDTQLGIVLRVQFRPTTSDRFFLTVRNTDFNTDSPFKTEFTEIRASLRYAHQL